MRIGIVFFRVMEFATIGIIGAFLAACLGIGVYTGRNVKTLKDYALGDYTLGAGALAMSMMATIIHPNCRGASSFRWKG